MKEQRADLYLPIIGSFLLLICAIFWTWKYSERNKDTEVSESYQQELVSIKLTYSRGDATWNKTMDMVIERFVEKYPDICIEVDENSEIQSSMYIDQVKKEIAVNNLGDVVEVKGMNIFEGSGIFCELPESITSLASYNEKSKELYFIPTYQTTQGILYNKKLFEQLELQEPDTYEEFIAICERLKRYELTPVVVGGKSIWHMGFWINHFYRTLVTSKQPDWGELRNAKEVSWQDETPALIVDSMRDLYENGYINKDFSTISDGEAIRLMASGNFGMLYSGPWVVSRIKEINPNIELGWFYLPDNNGNCYIFADRNSGWGITEECKSNPRKYDAALKFLKFFYSQEIYGDICKSMNAIPITSYELNTKMSPLFAEIKDKMEKATDISDIQIGDNNTPENFSTYAYRKIIDYMMGEVSKEVLLKELDIGWDECVDGKDGNIDDE